MAESVNPMDLLKEEMDSDDISVRINAMHRIKIVSTLIGVESTKSQLLPYIDGLIKKEDDEVLYAIAEELGNIAPLLGNQVTILIPYLETLASVEETVVRDASVKSLLTVASSLSDAEIVSLIAPMILRLCGGEWFTSRVSAVNLIPGIYTRAGNQKNPLKQKFIELCGEETPMVRRAVAMRIGDLASVVEKDVLHELITIFKQLTGDEQDSVKMLCLESLKQIAKILNKDENKTHIIPVVIAATEDKSWRVRQALSKNFAQIAEALGKEITDHHLIQNFTVVLRDAEIDVRSVAVQSLARLLQMNLLGQEKLMTLIPHIQALGKDSNPGVKVGIIQVLLNMIPLVGKDVVLTKLYPTALDLIEDEDSEVRIEAFKVISKVAQHLNADILTSLLPHLKTHLGSPKWRVRVAALDCVIDLALIFQSLDVFQKHLEPLFIAHLSDKACSIRDCAIRRIPELVTLFKVDWLNNVLLPKTLELLTKPESTYLLKVSVMYALRAMAQVVPNDYVNEKLLPHLLKGAKDPVPNVRVVVMKVFKGIAHKLDSSVINSTIKPLLQELSADPDRDVQFYAQDTLSAI